MRRTIPIPLLLATAACGAWYPEEEPETPTVEVPPATESTVEYETLDPARRLVRASMALRGIRPSLAELDRVEADPDAYTEIVDEYLASDEFGATVRQYFTEWMELDQAPDTYPAGFPPTGDLEGLGTHLVNVSIIEAAGRLAEHVVMTDAPWSEVVTADYTVADEIVATVWGLDYPWYTETGWQVLDYDDGRPVAGVLSDGWVFTRMPTTEGNRNRERASLVANTFVCHDYPNRPVHIPPTLDLTSEEAVANAIETNPVCVACHSTLDPLAAFFAVHYPLRIPGYVESYPLQQYTPELVADYGQPGWYGQPGEDLVDLGRMIADDPRFSSCSVRRFYSELMQVPLASVPQSAVSRFLPVFDTPEQNARALVRAIVLSDEFSARAVTRDPNGRAATIGTRRATPRQLDSLIEDLTGFRWMAEVPFDTEGWGPPGTVPLMHDYLYGYRTLAGGPNNFDTVEHIRTANPTTLLVLRSLAERAAAHVVSNDGSASNPILLDVDGAFEADRDAVVEQLVRLHRRLYGERVAADGPEVAASAALYSDAFDASGDPGRAWEITLGAMLQDPHILLY